MLHHKRNVYVTNAAEMELVQTYLYTVLLCFSAVVMWRVFRLIDLVTRQNCLSWLRKILIYTLVYQRREDTHNVSVLSFCNILLFLAGNITSCMLQLRNRTELSSRCGTLFIVNSALLFLGGKSSLLADRVLRLHPNDVSLFHRWVGRVCVIQGLVHGTINVLRSSPSFLQAIVSASMWLECTLN